MPRFPAREFQTVLNYFRYLRAKRGGAAMRNARDLPSLFGEEGASRRPDMINRRVSKKERSSRSLAARASNRERGSPDRVSLRYVGAFDPESSVLF